MGIGRTISEKFYKEGSRVIIASRNVENGKTFEKEFPGSVFVATDVRKEADVANLVKYIEKNFGCLDVLVNNASTISSTEGDIQNFSIDEVKDIFETNVYSVFFTVKHATNLL
ncbi:MAG: SDR family oxidoreductase [Candidatus Yonathbacteria bacterium]|nr:SDR family oxidoreductase [Candidatus Yonathbacteria bacterium]